VRLRVFIGYDRREHRAAEVAERSLRRHASIPVDVTRLDIDWLTRAGLMWRPVDRRERIYDLTSAAWCATDFSISRFLAAVLCPDGWSLFVDGDVVFLDDVADLVEEQADASKALMVVQHEYTPCGGVKMDSQPQQIYSRKNWSSVMLINSDHAANRRLTLHDVNSRRGLDLHQFYWLHDDELGALPARWNWLVGEQPRPADAALAHFTLGGPFLPDWHPAEHDDIWHAEATQ
jgi:lipopolysaccharide biosynthesis glycosyltransferase